MLYERFECYIKGGSYKNSRYHLPCEDETSPLAVRAVEIPHEMYFGNESGSWNGSGVSFLDVSSDGKAYGVAYLITEEQFEHVSMGENDGRSPCPGYYWYEDIIELGEMDGFKMKTLTNAEIRPYNKPSKDYLDTLRDGLKENFPELSNEEIENYLDACTR